MRSALACLVWLVCFSNLCLAGPTEVVKNIPNADLKGTAEFKFLSKVLYSAELWMENGSAFSFTEDFALSLTYATNLKAGVLSWASISEIARHEGVSKDQFDDLGLALKSCFGDIKKGDRITGLARGAHKISFFVNGSKSCDLSYPNIRSRFFGIWLGPKTRDPSGSISLRGG